jgi:putative membrane protein
MAAERTFLAWIRTALALVAFGFLVSRLAVSRATGALVSEPDRGALWLGGGLISAGLVTSIVASVRHHRYVRAIDERRFRAAFGSSLAYLLVSMLTLLGAWMLLTLPRT